MPKLTLDGRQIEVEAGTTILRAALTQAAEVPHYCYHPGLSIAGNCRMCLVEVERAPKLVIACATPVAEGMVVNTRNERVKRAQQAVMEFLLINHPLDCTICDQAGECRLQEYAFEFGRGRSRLNDAKVVLAKAVDIGPHVMLDQERCIQCSRCTRFCDEITGTGELAFFQRGDRTIIGIQPGLRLDNPYSGNVVDLCPVGALTLKEFRFQSRVWYLRHTPSVCAGCARGCNMMIACGTQHEAWTTRGQFDERIQRLEPRANEAVNAFWICDEGRLSYRRQHAPRLAQAEGPAGVTLEWETALERVAAVLREGAESGRAGAIFSPRAVCETFWSWNRLFAEVGMVQVGVRQLVRGEDDRLLLRADRGANSKGAEWVLPRHASADAILEAVVEGALDTLIVFGDPLDPEDTVQLDERTLAALRHLIYVGPFRDRAAEQASLLLPSAAWSEEDGSFVNFQGRVQWTRRAHLAEGEGRPGWRVAADLGEALGLDAPPWAATPEVFAAMAQDVEGFAGLDVETLGLLGRAGRVVQEA